MVLNIVLSFLISFLAPVHSTTSHHNFAKHNLTLMWMLEPLKYIPIHIYILGAGAILVVVIGGPTVMIYWYCCRGKETAAAERSRRVARVTTTGQAEFISSSGPPGGLQMAPPSYSDVAGAPPPAYDDTSGLPLQTVYTIQPRSDHRLDELPPAYKSPTPTNEGAVIAARNASSLPSEDPPTYTDSPRETSPLPPVV